MPTLMYRDTDGQFKELVTSGSGGGTGVDEVAISPTQPTDPLNELWVNTSESPPPVDWTGSDDRYINEGQAAGGSLAGTYPNPTLAGPAGGDLTGTFPNPGIAPGVIIDADVNASAAIAQSKIANLTTDLASKYPKTGGTLTGVVNSFANAAARDAALGTPGEGTECYLVDMQQKQIYIGGVWRPIGGFMPGVWCNRNAGTAMTSGVKQLYISPETTWWYGGLGAGANPGTVRTTVTGRYLICGTCNFGTGMMGCLGWGKDQASGVAAWGSTVNAQASQSSRSQFACILSMVPGIDHCLWISATSANYTVSEVIYSITYLAAF